MKQYYETLRRFVVPLVDRPTATPYDKMSKTIHSEELIIELKAINNDNRRYLPDVVLKQLADELETAYLVSHQDIDQSLAGQDGYGLLLALINIKLDEISFSEKYNI